MQPAPGASALPTLYSVIAHLAVGDGGLAAVEVATLREARAGVFEGQQAHYWHGLALLLAFDWPAAARELRAYVAHDAQTWRAGWAYLHLGRAYEQAGRDEEAALAYRGCLAVEGAERPARKLAFELMSRLATELPMGYGQATTRPVEKNR